MIHINEDFFSIKRAVELCAIADFDSETTDYILAFLSDADEDIKKFAYLFYYLQFLGEEDFAFNIWELDTIPVHLILRASEDPKGEGFLSDDCFLKLTTLP